MQLAVGTTTTTTLTRLLHLHGANLKTGNEYSVAASIYNVYSSIMRVRLSFDVTFTKRNVREMPLRIS